MKETVNWAILAPGIIANSMATAMNGAKTLPEVGNKVNLYAVASRNLERAKDFAEKWHFEKAYGTYEELFADPEVDAIYIANPHAFHYDSVMKALNAGKHILCEKPAGCSINQLNDMINLAKSKNLFFMEAMWTAFNPCIKYLQKIIAEGVIGEIKHIESRFCNRIPYDPKNRLWAPELAGGALLDLGIYNIYFASMIAGTQNITHHSSTARLYDGIDAWNSVTLTFENGITTSFQSACDMPAGSDSHDATIFGTKGFICVENFFMTQKAWVHTYTNQWGNQNEITSNIEEKFLFNGYEYELIEATNCILEGKTESSVHTHKKSQELCKTMDMLRKDWNMKYPWEN
ncbi:MAG: Gfo/Idh/MocA family oxidoreductase [Treponema sp.]|nr:Gfo/Idh/MocA family oxidoreductase [Treponema sp.]